MADINLIPQEVKKEQKAKEAVKTTTYVVIGLSILVLGLAGFLMFRRYSIIKQSKQVDTQIGSLRTEITGLSEIEISARNLNMKYDTLKNILTSRNYNSLLMAELKAKIPANVAIDTFATGRDNTISISGIAPDYLSVSEYVNSLASTGSIFTNVSLNSVNLDVQTAKARFFIVLTIDPARLKK